MRLFYQQEPTSATQSHNFYFILKRQRLNNCCTISLVMTPLVSHIFHHNSRTCNCHRDGLCQERTQNKSTQRYMNVSYLIWGTTCTHSLWSAVWHQHRHGEAGLDKGNRCKLHQRSMLLSLVLVATGSLVQSKWCHYVMVEADSQLNHCFPHPQ